MGHNEKGQPCEGVPLIHAFTWISLSISGISIEPLAEKEGNKIVDPIDLLKPSLPLKT